MTPRIPEHIALCAATDLTATDGAPDWVHLVPTLAGPITTFDGRGPYRIDDASTVIAQSMAGERGMPIDENHATDLAAPAGHPAPARGWIVELQSRADGIWGRVEWTDEGKALVSGKAYRGLSPVLAISKADKKTVVGVLRASLVNTPNLRGLTALHQESQMDFLKKLAAMLGLGEAASEAEVASAIEALTAKPAEAAMQAALKDVGIALGLEGTADTAAITAAAKAFGKETVTALQAQLGTVTSELNTLRESTRRTAAVALIDGAIAEGRVGVKPLRDHYITRHMSDPASVEKELAALPKLEGKVLPQGGAQQGATITELNAEQTAVADQLGIPRKDFIAQLNAAASKEQI